MSLWLLLRLGKAISVALLTTGLLGGLLASDATDRQRAVYAIATPAFVLTWFFGYGLARTSGISLGSPWIGLSMLLSLGALQGAVLAVERPRRSLLAAALVGLVLAGSFGLMVWRPGTVTAVHLEQ